MTGVRIYRPRGPFWCSPRRTDPCFLCGCMYRPIGLPFFIYPSPSLCVCCKKAKRYRCLCGAEAKHSERLYTASRPGEQVKRARSGHRRRSGFPFKRFSSYVCVFKVCSCVCVCPCERSGVREEFFFLVLVLVLAHFSKRQCIFCLTSVARILTRHIPMLVFRMSRK